MMDYRENRMTQWQRKAACQHAQLRLYKWEVLQESHGCDRQFNATLVVVCMQPYDALLGCLLVGCRLTETYASCT